MPTYTYRRDLSRSDWMKAVGVAAGAGAGTALVVGYFARIFLQRTPLSEPAPRPAAPARGARELPPRRP